MNIFDIILYLALVWAVVNGLTRGLAVQLVTLAGVVAALYLAAAYGREAGGLLGFEAPAAGVAGFIVIFVAALVVVGVAGRLMRSVFVFAGLGVLDSILGILFSAVKVLLVLSVLYAWFSALNADFEWVGRETIEESKWFDSVAGISERLTPYFEDLKQKITV